MTTMKPIKLSQFAFQMFAMIALAVTASTAAVAGGGDISKIDDDTQQCAQEQQQTGDPIKDIRYQMGDQAFGYLSQFVSQPVLIEFVNQLESANECDSEKALSAVSTRVKQKVINQINSGLASFKKELRSSGDQTSVADIKCFQRALAPWLFQYPYESALIQCKAAIARN